MVWFTSIESFAKVLSGRNRELLALIAREKPDSLTELAGARRTKQVEPVRGRSRRCRATGWWS